MAEASEGRGGERSRAFWAAVEGRLVEGRKSPAQGVAGNAARSQNRRNPSGKGSFGLGRRCSFVTDPYGYAPHSRLAPGQNPSLQGVFYPTVWSVCS